MRKFLLATGLAALAGSAAAATQIGVTSAVIPAARGTPTEGNTRVLQVGLDMQANERVQTDAGGKAHLLFLDGSALSVGPGSDLVLDEFVYDPQSRTGRIALSATRGVFRLVGGAISKTNPVTLRTPTATVGVRGGIAVIDVGRTVVASFLFGSEMTVAGGGAIQRVERPGFQVTTTVDGEPQTPTPLPETANLLSPFEGGDRSAAGQPPVTDEDVASSQVGLANSIAALGEIAPAAGGAAPPPPAAPQELTSEASQEQTTDEAARQAGGSPTPPANGGEDDGPPALPPEPPVTLDRTLSGRAKHASDPLAFGTDDGVQGQEVVFAGATVTNGVFDAAVQQVELCEGECDPIEGLRLTLPAAPGAFEAASSAQPFGEGQLVGIGQLSPDRQFLFYELSDTGDGHKVVAFAGVPTPLAALPTGGATFYRLRRDFPLDSDVPFIPGDSGGDALAGVALSRQADTAIVWDTSQSPNAQVGFAARTVAIVGQGVQQKSVASVITGEIEFGEVTTELDGEMRGTSRVSPDQFAHAFKAEPALSDDGSDNEFFGADGPNNFVLEAMAGNDGIRDSFMGQVTDGIQPNNVALPAAGALGARSTRTINGYSGGVARYFESDGVTVDGFSTILTDGDDPGELAVATDAATNKVVVDLVVEEECCFAPTAVLQFGDPGLDDERGVFLDDRSFAATESNSFTPTLDGDDSDADLYFVTSDALEAVGLLPAGVQFCACQYAVWGFWGGDVVNGEDDRILRTHLAAWAAGPISNASAIDVLTGTATYDGHAIGSVKNGTNVYLAVGALQLTADFAQQRITGGSISNYDGGSYNVVNGQPFNQLDISLNTFRADLAGASGTALGRSGSLDGSFVQGGADPAAEVVGHFEAGGTGYDTAGVLIGRKVGP